MAIAPSSPSAKPTDFARTQCPRDGDAFSYNPAHLAAWYMPQDLWTRLPSQLLASLAAVQHAGAAVLTGFERLEGLGSHLLSVPEERPLVLNLELGEGATTAHTKLRSLSNASTGSSSPSTGSPASSMSSSPMLSSTYPTALVSPLSLTPACPATPPAHPNHHRSFTTPLDPHSAYYAAELSYLRTEALPRLRHSTRRVGTEWVECKLTADASTVAEFEAWWGEKRDYVRELDSRGKHLSVAMGLADNGLGWTAP
ncbi:hypothetical protein K432DRAFT_415025 [Lepidopterella palustris CBS 459.81]|uniref:Uncharacterized protein n=1 Tax=Lepidopterella palustris CBS 459.81 TaxID=1314670 RepID=A0A8E2EF88_9PEZI|nr:hypothetical protein K432DRAFT_415025 [Lepidopterella palustris CBS 459.81]